MSSLAALVEQVSRLAPCQGVHPTALPCVAAFRFEAPTPRSPVVYDPCLIIVVQGRKTGYLAERVFTYHPREYLVLSVPLPLECTIQEASPETPFLAIQVDLDPAVLREVVLAADDDAGEEVQTAIRTSALTPALQDVTLRLLRAVEDPVDARVLGPLHVRELLYRASRGPQGAFLRALALGRGASRRIAQVLQLIHTDYDQPLSVPDLAQEAHLGVSTFHQAFKAATAMTPLQYVKSVRLHQARSLMLHEELTAAEASYRVGYNSPSQFSREFKRFFGQPPVAELERLRNSALPLPPPVPPRA